MSTDREMEAPAHDCPACRRGGASMPEVSSDTNARKPRTFTIYVCPRHGIVSRAACHAMLGDGVLYCTYCGSREQEVETVEVVEKLPTREVVAGRWRVGRSLGRTLYIGDEVIGMVDTSEQAATIVAAMNREARDEAVRIVDARHGYTVEQAPNPDAHREEYDREEARLAAGEPCPDCGATIGHDAATQHLSACGQQRRLDEIRANAPAVIGRARLALREGDNEEARRVLDEHAAAVDRVIREVIAAAPHAQGETRDAEWLREHGGDPSISPHGHDHYPKQEDFDTLIAAASRPSQDTGGGLTARDELLLLADQLDARTLSKVTTAVRLRQIAADLPAAPSPTGDCEREALISELARNLRAGATGMATDLSRARCAAEFIDRAIALAAPSSPSAGGEGREAGSDLRAVMTHDRMVRILACELGGDWGAEHLRRALTGVCIAVEDPTFEPGGQWAERGSVRFAGAGEGRTPREFWLARSTATPLGMWHEVANVDPANAHSSWIEWRRVREVTNHG